MNKVNSQKVDFNETGQLEEEAVVRDVTARVLAPALNGFVLWFLDEAMKHNIKRLYFLARDGYFMYLYAKRYVEQYDLPIECRYLYCSRYSLRVPMYHLDIDEALSYVTLGGLDVSLDKIMRRASLTREQEETVLQELKIGYEPEEQISRDELSNVKEALRNCGIFMQYLKENSQEAMPALQEYIRQEGLLDDVKMALVDSGWVGSMQKQLNKLVHYVRQQELVKADGVNRANVPQTKLSGYYWGLYDLPAGVSQADYHTYYFKPGGDIRRKVYFSNCLFEGIFSAPHGMTLGYEKVGDVIKPRLADISSKRREFLELTEKYLLDYEEVTKISHTDRLKQTEKLMRQFMSKPSKEEACSYGQLYFSDDVLEYKGRQMAEEMTEKELRKNHLLSRVMNQFLLGDKPVKQSAWYEGSAVLYGRYVRWHRLGYVAYKYFLYYRQNMIWRQKK